MPGVLASAFALSGFLKAFWSKERLLESGQTGVVFFPPWAIKMIASAEILAVLGLLGPSLIGRWETLTPLAGVSICLLMVGAAVTHIRLSEPLNVFVNALLFLAAAAVAVGRF